jgi:Calcineurin-like phosphoesterase
MRRRRLPGFALASLLGLAAITGLGRPVPAVAQAAQVQWSGVDRLIAFADVHGAYAELVTLLRETGIVDAQDRWAAGRTHVVSLGDLLDRGADSRRVMDLLMRLQGEAQAAGGQLHVVLGNHEAMNVLGDLRYVDAGEYASYTDTESATERAELRKAWEATQGTGSGPAFDQKFPPGYFGHRAALSPQGKYGQWLLSLPVAIAINDTLFMHAGPSNVLRGMSLQELNLRYRTALTEYLGLADRLEQARLLQPGDEFHARPRLARERLAVLTAAASMSGGTADGALTGAVQRFEAADDDALLAPDGPNWYRGAALCNEAAEADVLLPLLQQFGVTRLVVGHTPTRDLRAVTRFDGRVVKLDAGMNRAAYKGRAVALFLQPAGLSVRYAGEPDAVPLRPEGLFVAPNELDDAGVLAALNDGEVTVTGPRGPNELNVSVSHAGKRIPAVFQVRNAGAARKEIAAYRLDRQLGLGIVPVTVEREVQGQRGVLQGRPLKWVTQTEVQQQQLRGGGWCGAEPQFQLVYAFDTLIGNEGRMPDSLLFDSNAWYVYVTAHDRAFGSSKSLPAYLKARPPAPGAEVRRRAAMLNEANLATSLGELVDAKERKAILVRRDALLALPAAANAAAKNP